MKDISTAMQAMIDNGQFINPSCQIVCDIDPPFVGKDFDQSGCDPSLCVHNGVLYLVFVDDDYIKIVVLDQVTMKVTGLLRTILAVGASRPRLIFEPATYPDQADLPHVAYVNAGVGKVYCYREQYNEDLTINKITDEIGTGSDIEVIQIGGSYYHFYIGADSSIYQRKQGDYAAALITSDSGESITGLRVMILPDGRIGLLYAVHNSDDTGEIRVAYTNLMLPIDGGSDRFELNASLTSWLYKTGVFVFGKNSEYQYHSVQDDGFELAASLPMLKIFMLGQNANESFELLALMNKIIFSAPVSIDEKFELAAVLSKVVLSSPHDFTDSFQLSASLQMLKIFMLGQIANESFELSALMNKIIFSAPVSFDESFGLSTLLSKVVLSLPHDFTDSFQLNASLHSVTFT